MNPDPFRYHGLVMKPVPACALPACPRSHVSFWSLSLKRPMAVCQSHVRAISNNTRSLRHQSPESIAHLAPLHERATTQHAKRRD